MVQFFCVVLYDDDHISNSSDYDYVGNGNINDNYQLWIVQNYFATNWSIAEGRKLLKCAVGNIIFMDVLNYPYVRSHLSKVT